MSTEGKALPSASPRLGRLRASPSCMQHSTQGADVLHAARRSTGGSLVPRAAGRRGLPTPWGAQMRHLGAQSLCLSWLRTDVFITSPVPGAARCQSVREKSPWLPGQHGGAGQALPAAICLVSVPPNSAHFTDSPLPAPLLGELWQRSR